MTRRKPTRKKTDDAVEMLMRTIRNDPRRMRRVERFRLNIRISMLIYDARTDAMLTQAQLARRVGTTQSVISRLEDAEYEGHSLGMLQRIAAALHRRVEVILVPEVA